MAAFTSELKRTGTPRARWTAPAKSKFLHVVLGVEVMNPQVGDSGLRSTGPKDPIPMALSPPPECSRNHATAAATVGSGPVVEISMVTRSSGQVPAPHTNL